jgi:hypothetical protein
MGQDVPPQGGHRRLKIWSPSVLILSLLAAAEVAALAQRDISAVRARQTILEAYRGLDDFRVVRKCDQPACPRAQNTNEVSWLRWLLGDRAVLLVLLPYRDASDEELLKVREAFPEAIVRPSPLSKPRMTARNARLKLSRQ